MKEKTIAEIKQMLTEGVVDDNQINVLRQDGRKGVQQLIRRYEYKQKKEQKLLQAHEEKRRFDEQFTDKNSLLAGVDEAGRGPLAGPVTAAAVILPTDFYLPGLTDSKQLTETARNVFYEIIRNEAIAYHIAVIDRDVIDNVNIYEATKIAMNEAIKALIPIPQVALIDAVKLTVPEVTTEAVIKGDDRSLAIAAASILAKVKRDEIMTELDQVFPTYEFKNNKGYGTKNHLTALKTHGPSPCHRRSFAPVTMMSEKEEKN